ncbi:hypothetical protein FB107DRAFT_175986, partial [Schizophyllum commune]
PSLFDFYFGDLSLRDRPGDISLGGIRVKNVEQADDGNLFSHGVPHLQDRLTEFVEYAEGKDLHTNVAKTDAVAFNCRRGPIPPLHIYDKDLCWKAEAVSVGVLFCTAQGDILNMHHLRQASKAQSIAGATLALINYLGDLPPALALKLYKSRIDPILCFGCEIGTAISPATLHALEQVQLNFLRRILGLSKKSTCILPFTETGILPIRYRRLILALR